MVYLAWVHAWGQQERCASVKAAKKQPAWLLGRILML